MKHNHTLLLATLAAAGALLCCTPKNGGAETPADPSGPVTPGTPENPDTPPTPDPDPTPVQCIDAPLTLKLDAAPVLGTAGTICVYQDNGTLVDKIDLADLAQVQIREDGAMIPKEKVTADTPFHTFLDVIPSGSRYRIVPYTPLRVKDKALEIKLHGKVLDFGKTYYVTVDAGVVKDHPGVKAKDWTFKVKEKPASAELKVRKDGTGDFCTVQGALSHAATLGKTTAVTVDIGAGTYEEMLFLRDKDNVTLKGASRSGTVIAYPNAENYCGGTGASTGSKPKSGSKIATAGGRCLFLAENCDALTLQSLTLRNTFDNPKGQAETIYFNSGSNAHKLTVEDCALWSWQDTFLCKGVVWVHNSLIAGHCDFIWGYPAACLFEDCEIRARDAGYIVQARIQKSTDKGFVFLNCRLTAESGVKDGSMYLARSGGSKDYFDNVTFVGCTFSPAIASAGWYTSPAPNPSVPTAQSGWKEYGSVNASGAPVSGHHSYGKVLTQTEAAAFSSRSAVLGY